MDIRELAEELNEKASEYEIGNLQEIRKSINDLKIRPGSKIFSNKTIYNKEGYAFHHGGRKEIQFNIGFENGDLRYGLAFSLEKSQTLKDPQKLYPKIRKLNNIFREKPGYFSNYLLWHYDKTGERSKTMKMREIPSSIVEPGSFIFLGKLEKIEDIDKEKILSEFDKLLKIYIAVETYDNEDFELKSKDIEDDGFVFTKDNRDLVFNKEYSSVEKQTNINVRHSEIQAKLIEQLEEKYRKENVSLENPFRGNRIDVVVKRDDEDYVFYEVKTDSSVKDCIRQAIGQLLEYGFWPGEANASKLVVVGEANIERKSKTYLSFLRNELNIPIEYLCIEIDNE